jgi:hypothetical protein
VAHWSAPRDDLRGRWTRGRIRQDSEVDDAMIAPRLTIAKLAVLVAVVAVDLAAGRALLAGETLLFGVGLFGLSLQLAAFRFLWSRGRPRAFWLGFLLAGAATLASFLWGLPRPGQYRGPSMRVSSKDPWAMKVLGYWAEIGETAAVLYGHPCRRVSWHGEVPWPGRWYSNPKHRIWVLTASACGTFATQLSLAMAGGIPAWWIAGARRRFREGRRPSLRDQASGRVDPEADPVAQ